MRLPVYYPAVRLARGKYASGERDYRPSAPTRSAIDRRSATTPIAWSPTPARPASTTGSRERHWKSPPILDSPTRDLKMRGRKYELFYDGDRLRLVAWRTPRGAYWVSNTLSQKLTNSRCARSPGR